MLPWLSTFSHAKFAGRPEIIKAEDIESVGYIIQTRMCPPPPLDDVRFEKEYIGLKEQFTKEAVFTEGMEQETTRATASFVQALTRYDRKPVPHLSLTTNGAYEGSRTEGGRALVVCKGFIECFVHAIPTKNIADKTWWGAPYIEQIDIAPYRTMCRTYALDQKFWFRHSLFQEDNASGGIMDLILSSVNSVKKKLFEKPF